jgi:hypothetical protein
VTKLSPTDHALVFDYAGRLTLYVPDRKQEEDIPEHGELTLAIFTRLESDVQFRYDMIDWWRTLRDPDYESDTDD